MSNFQKEKYEKEIERLESENSILRAQLEARDAESNKQRLKLLKQEEDFYKGLVAFMSSLYQELSRIQSGVLENVSKLNNHLSGISEKRTKESLAKVQAALEILGMPEVKTTSGFMLDDS